jgi:hypothetical protein
LLKNNLKNMTKKNKKYLIIAIIVVLTGTLLTVAKFFLLPRYSFFSAAETEASSTDIFVGGKPASLIDFNSYGTDAVSVIGDFEEGEDANWQGNGVVDNKVYYEGERSLALISVDHKTSVITLNKNFDLSKMKMIEFMLNVSDTDSFESAEIDFGDAEFKNRYRYVLSNLKAGWNLIQIPKEQFIALIAPDSQFDWSKISQTRFYASSRPGAIFMARIDMLRSINNMDFENEWRSLKNESFLSLVRYGDSNMLMVRSIATNMATIKILDNISDFVFLAAVLPQSTGRIGLFVRGDSGNGYGYYFLIGGAKKNNWQILKKNKTGWVKEKEIDGFLPNMSFMPDKKYWLKVAAQGGKMVFYLSFDGEKYDKLAELNDDEFLGGSSGIADLDGRWCLFDDFQASR